MTPLNFLERSADVWADRPAVPIENAAGPTPNTPIASAGSSRGLKAELDIDDGDRVATLLPNVAAMLELHYAVPGAGAVLVPLNTRLAARDYAHILIHSAARAIFAASSLQAPLEEALAALKTSPPRVVWVDLDGADSDYEALIEGASPGELRRPGDERALLSINYTSGTTGRPKG